MRWKVSLVCEGIILLSVNRVVADESVEYFLCCIVSVDISVVDDLLLNLLY